MAEFWNKTGKELKILWLAAVKSTTENMNDLAAAIAFWAFLSIFPLLLGAFSFSSYMLDSAEPQERARLLLTDMLPGCSDVVVQNLDLAIEHRGTMSWISGLFLLWTVSKAFGVMTRAANRDEIRGSLICSFLRTKLQHLSMALLLSVLIIASTLLGMAMEILLDPEILSRLGLEDLGVSRLRGWLLNAFLVFVTFILIYKMAPRARVPWRKIVPGALLGSLSFGFIKTAFVFYLNKTAPLSTIYGSISSIMVLLFWLYISAVILVYGAQYNAVRWRLNHPEMDESTGDK